MADAQGYTKSERRILEVLKDGERHRRNEVFDALKNGDEFMDRMSLHNHMARLRVKLRRKGQDIVMEYYLQALYYRQVRLLLSVNSGRSE